MIYVNHIPQIETLKESKLILDNIIFENFIDDKELDNIGDIYFEDIKYKEPLIIEDIPKDYGKVKKRKRKKAAGLF